MHPCRCLSHPAEADIDLCSFKDLFRYHFIIWFNQVTWRKEFQKGSIIMLEKAKEKVRSLIIVWICLSPIQHPQRKSRLQLQSKRHVFQYHILIIPFLNNSLFDFNHYSFHFFCKDYNIPTGLEVNQDSDIKVIETAGVKNEHGQVAQLLLYYDDLIHVKGKVSFFSFLCHLFLTSIISQLSLLKLILG